MNTTTVAIIAFIAVFPMLALGIPVAYALGIIGVGGLIALNGLGPMMGVFTHLPYTTLSHYSFLVIPLFTFMGYLAYHSGTVEEAFWAIRKWLGHIPGGLAIVTIGAAGIFAASSGSSIAATATLARIAIPEMKRYNYRMDLAAGVCAAGGPLAIMIPPSITLVIYGILTEQSIGKLLMAGFIPGIIMCLFFILYVYIRAKLNPQIAMPLPKAEWHERFSTLRFLWPIALVVAIIMGGIYTGIFTATEAGAVAAFAMLAVGLARRKLGWNGLKKSMLETGYTTSMILIILVGVIFFVYFLAFTGVPLKVSKFITELPLPRMGILAVITLLYIFLGCFMEALGIMTLTLPVIFPAMKALGFDPIWFGIYIVLVVEMGLLTPPVGLTVFTVKGVFPELPLNMIFKGAFPFFLILIFMLVLISAFPQIALFLPGTMR